jgi:hypothetical protein
VDSMSARSGAPACFLIPMCSPAKRKPAGNALEGGVYF